MLEHGELKIDVYHQMSSTNESNQQNDKRPLDVHLCYCTIPLKELISRHTGKWKPFCDIKDCGFIFKESKVGIH